MKIKHEKGLNYLQVLHDSKLVIEWANPNHNIGNLHLKPFMNQIVEVKYNFHYISFTYLYREFNTNIENLSKDALLLQEGNFTKQVFIGDTVLLASKSHFY